MENEGRNLEVGGCKLQTGFRSWVENGTSEGNGAFPGKGRSNRRLRGPACLQRQL